MANKKKPTAAKRGEGPTSQALRFSGKNALLGAAGLVAVGFGYLLLSQGSITAAPLLLVLGYVILLPLAIVL